MVPWIVKSYLPLVDKSIMGVNCSKDLDPRLLAGSEIRISPHFEEDVPSLDAPLAGTKPNSVPPSWLNKAALSEQAFKKLRKGSEKSFLEFLPDLLQSVAHIDEVRDQTTGATLLLEAIQKKKYGQAQILLKIKADPLFEITTVIAHKPRSSSVVKINGKKDYASCASTCSSTVPTLDDRFSSKSDRKDSESPTNAYAIQLHNDDVFPMDAASSINDEVPDEDVRQGGENSLPPGTTSFHLALSNSIECSLPLVLLLDHQIATSRYEIDSIHRILDSDHPMIQNPSEDTQHICTTFNALSKLLPQYRYAQKVQVASLTDFKKSLLPYLHDETDYSTFYFQVNEPSKITGDFHEELVDNLKETHHLLCGWSHDHELLDTLRNWIKIQTSKESSIRWQSFGSLKHVIKDLDTISDMKGSTIKNFFEASLQYFSEEQIFCYLQHCLFVQDHLFFRTLLPILRFIQHIIIDVPEFKHKETSYLTISISEDQVQKLFKGQFLWFKPQFIVASSARDFIAHRLAISDCLVTIHLPQDCPAFPVKVKNKSFDDVIFPWMTAFQLLNDVEIYDGASFGYPGRNIYCLEVAAFRPLRVVMENFDPEDIHEDFMQKLLRIHGHYNKIDARLLRGNIYFKKRFYREAIKEFNVVLRIEKNKLSDDLREAKRLKKLTEKFKELREKRERDLYQQAFGHDDSKKFKEKDFRKFRKHSLRAKIYFVKRKGKEKVVTAPKDRVQVISRFGKKRMALKDDIDFDFGEFESIYTDVARCRVYEGDPDGRGYIELRPVAKAIDPHLDQSQFSDSQPICALLFCVAILFITHLWLL